MFCWIKQEPAVVDEDQNSRDEIGPSLKSVKKEFVTDLDNIKKEPVDILAQKESATTYFSTARKRKDNNVNQHCTVNIKEEFVPNSSDNPRASNSKPNDIDIKEHFPLDNNKTGLNYVEVPVEFDETKNSKFKLSENLLIPVVHSSGARLEDLKIEALDTSTFLKDSKCNIKKELNIHCKFCDFSTAVKSDLDKHLRIHTKEKPYKCVRCDYKTTKKVYLNHHIKVKHSMKKRFSCHICSQRFVSRQWLMSHIFRHTGEKPYKCDYCDHSTTVRSSLVQHIRRHTGEKPYQCDYCDYSTAAKMSLVNHIKCKHVMEKNFSCNICLKRFVTIQYLNTHLRLHADDKPYKCEQCDYSTTVKLSLTNHIKGKHTVEKSFSCDMCPNNFFTREELNSHVCVNIGAKRYKCHFCGHSSTRKSSLVKHIRRHTGEKPYKCELCDYSTAVRLSLTNHIKGKHLMEKNFSCHICSKKFVTKYHLQTHIRIHTGDKPYKCGYCDYSTSVRLNLTNHIKGKHAMAETFSCNICQNSFVTRDDLNSHVRKHKNEKPYKCDYCDYSTTVKSSMVVHTRKHTGEKPYKCNYCDHRTTIRSSLVVHMRIHTGERPYQCHYCEYKSTTKVSLNLHSKKHKLEKKFSCLNCQYKSVTKNELDLHICQNTRKQGHKFNISEDNTEKNLNNDIQNHAMEKNFACTICPKKFVTKQWLIAHTRTHTGENLYKCQYCDYSTAVKNNLVQHVRIHTGEKPYKCELCDFSSARQSDLSRHFRLHTGEKPYQCELCLFSTADKRSLINHGKAKHTMERSFSCHICSKQFVSKGGLNSHVRRHTAVKPYKCELCDYSDTDRSNLAKHVKAIHVMEQTIVSQEIEKCIKIESDCVKPEPSEAFFIIMPSVVKDFKEEC